MRRLPKILGLLLLSTLAPRVWTTGGSAGVVLPPARSPHSRGATGMPAPHPGKVGPAAAAIPSPAGAPRDWQTGADISLPLPDGTPFSGRLVSHSRKVGLEAWGGRARNGSGATFFVRQTEAGDYQGLLRFPGLPALVVLRGASPDALTATAAPVDRHVCQGLPRPRGEPEAAPLAAGEPQAAPPLLSSLPSASSVIYLDMDGEVVNDPMWNSGDTITAAAPSFSQTTITRIWERVSDDFRPFNVNVTTELAVFEAAPAASRMRCIFTPTTAWYPGAGGVAYVGSFTWGNDTPCWVFNGSEGSAAEAASHEVGHTLGLYHDGRTSPAEDYYEGHGSGAVGWAPIMGVGYYKLLVQWSKGEYLNADELVDDLDTITRFNGFGYRADDHAATLAAATQLTPGVGGAVSATGLIERRADQDGFRFTSNGGSVTFTVTPGVRSANLDALAEILDGSGAVLASNNPDTALAATVSASVPAGTYLLRVDGVGRGSATADGYTDYGSLGSYTITGTIANQAPSQTFTLAENTPVPVVLGTMTVIPNPGGDLVYTITAGDALGAFTLSPAGVLTCTSAAALDHEAYPAHTLDVEGENPANPGVFSYGRLVVNVTDVNEPPVLGALPSTRLAVDEVAGALLATAVAADPEGQVTYSLLSGHEDGAFAIEPTTGAITLADPARLDPFGQPKRELVVLARDGGNPALESQGTLAISVLRNLVGPQRPYRYVVPTSATQDALWRQVLFDDSAWLSGQGGLGFDSAPDYLPYIQTTVAGMLNARTGCYQRFLFAAREPGAYDRLELGIRYEDGFVAYLNGVRVAGRAAPATAVWNSLASTSRDEALAVQFEWIDLSSELPRLNQGLNVLAVHGLNTSTTSSDFLLHPVLRAGFAAPTPPSGPVLGPAAATALGTSLAASVTVACAEEEVPTGLLCFGLADGGTTRSAWPYAVEAGIGNGRWTPVLTNLLGATTYYARFLARTSAGETWSPSTVSFTTTGAEETWITPTATARWQVPTSGADEALWHGRLYNDSTWSAGAQGFGYERSTGYDSLIATDVESASYNLNTTLWLRFPFTVTDPSVVTSLTLRVKFDDAFVAHINGVRVGASSTAPANPAWNSTAAGSNPDASAIQFAPYSILTLGAPALVAGTNVLAVQVMNDSRTSSDFLFVAELKAGVRPSIPPFAEWMHVEGVPSPGGPEGDDDGDGASNFLELASAGDPADGGVLPLPVLGLLDPTAGPCLRYARRLDRVQRGITYVVETSPSPNGPEWTVWNATPVAAPVPLGDGLHEWISIPVPASPSRLYTRLRIRGSQ